jgi:cytoskeletal protein CcmA (bactofilin family)
MGWFDRTPPPLPPRTVLSHTAVLEGDLETRSDVEVHGRITGRVKTDATLRVGRDGLLDGEARCSVLEVAGRIKGLAAAAGPAVFEESARFEGELSAGRLRIASGAALLGRIRESRS